MPEDQERQSPQGSIPRGHPEHRQNILEKRTVSVPLLIDGRFVFTQPITIFPLIHYLLLIIFNNFNIINV
jgi:hypothetical protein